MGPSSYIWEGFVNADTRKAEYSIELARVSFHGEQQASNVTFGATEYPDYANMPNLTANADPFNYSYAANMSYGIVYQNNGADSSEFYYEMPTGYPVAFSTNFKGLGLPSAVYS